MHAIPGEIKARVILISNDMPDESTDGSTKQPTYRLTTCFTVISSLTSGQSTYMMTDRPTEDFHPRLTVDQAEGLCHLITLHFGRLNIETGVLYYCITVFELG